MIGAPFSLLRHVFSLACRFDFHADAAAVADAAFLRRSCFAFSPHYFRHDFSFDFRQQPLHGITFALMPSLALYFRAAAITERYACR